MLKVRGKILVYLYEQDQKSTRCKISKPDIVKPDTAKTDIAIRDTCKKNWILYDIVSKGG